jgi:hypothetical protein
VADLGAVRVGRFERGAGGERENSHFWVAAHAGGESEAGAAAGEDDFCLGFQQGSYFIHRGRNKGRLILNLWSENYGLSTERIDFDV